MRPPTSPLARVSIAAAAAGALLVAAPAVTSAASTPAPQRTVRARTLTSPTGTLAPGSRISPSEIAIRRIFFGGSFGVAFASTGGEDAATYPVQTGNGGRTWRTTGPALEIEAAQAPLVVSELGAATRALQYAYGDGQVVDVTSTGGPTWRQALFDGIVVAVVPGSGRTQLVAFVDSGQGGPVSQYVTRDGGRTWHYSTRAQLTG